MNEIKSEDEYQLKKEQVLSKFKEEFVKENYYNDPLFHRIVEMLIRDADPYEIIERLIIDRKELNEKTTEFLKYHSSPTIVPDQSKLF